jgi:dihydrofolate reductase
MRKLVVSEFMSLDGVMEDPGGETTYKHGGWTRPFAGEKFMQFKSEELFASSTLLLGRVTYDGFAKAWPKMMDMGPFAEKMNKMKKFVVSTTLTDPTWENSEVISEDVVQKIAQLRDQAGENILVAGSSGLLKTLIDHDLVDEYRLLLYPLVLGTGKRLFEANESARLDLIQSDDLGNGVVSLIYRPVRSQ